VCVVLCGKLQIDRFIEFNFAPEFHRRTIFSHANGVTFANLNSFLQIVQNAQEDFDFACFMLLYPSQQI
jgi:hypothetical protein